MTATELAAGVAASDRRALARAITLVESTRPDDRQVAAQLLDDLLPRTGGAIRVAITGSPGSGKSTFIEALGLHLVATRHRVAVLAVDPSSVIGGGSVLGDKTRMDELSRSPDAFVRPSPSAGSVGGVARRTREALLLCEAAGYDVVLVETVGIGQSETAVAEVVDVMVLVTAPGGGDELQGIKRGIMEWADLVIVNKADGDLQPAADRAVSDLRRAMALLRGRHAGWVREVVRVSSTEGTGVEDAWAAVVRLHHYLRENGGLDRLREEQAVSWMWDEVRQALVDDARSRFGDAATVVDAVRRGDLAPTSGAQELLRRLDPRPDHRT